MGKPTNIAGPSTAHSQAKEFAALAGVASAPADVTTLQQLLKTAIAKQAELTEQNEALTQANNEGAGTVALMNTKIDELTEQLTAEKEAHAKTQAALTAATAS